MKRLEKAKPMRLKEALNSDAISINANHNIIAHLLVSDGLESTHNSDLMAHRTLDGGTVKQFCLVIVLFGKHDSSQESRSHCILLSRLTWDTGM